MGKNGFKRRAAFTANVCFIGQIGSKFSPDFNEIHTKEEVSNKFQQIFTKGVT